MAPPEMLMAGILFLLGCLQALALAMRNSDKEEMREQRENDRKSITELFALDRERSKELTLAVRGLTETVTCLREDIRCNYALSADLEQHRKEGHERYSGIADKLETTQRELLEVRATVANINRYGCSAKEGSC